MSTLLQSSGTTRSHDSLLNRISLENSSPSTPLQSRVDGWVGSFSHHATEPSTLASFLAGGLAFRTARLGAASAASSWLRNSPHVLRSLSFGAGIVSEAAAFEIAHRSTAPLSSSYDESRRWRFFGHGGLSQGFTSSLLTFLILRGSSPLLRGENLVTQHLAQDFGLVLSHQLGARMGLSPAPQGAWVDQFLSAELSQWQWAAGAALLHRSLPRLHALEGGLDLSLRGNSGPSPRRGPLDFYTPLAASAGSPRPSPENREGPRGPLTLWMQSKASEGPGESPYSASTPKGRPPEELNRETNFSEPLDLRAQSLTSPADFLPSYLQSLAPFLRGVQRGDSLEGLRRLLEGSGLQAEEFRSYTHFSDSGYQRRWVLRHRDFEILLLSWKPGQGTRIHDHGGSEGLDLILSGEAREISYREHHGGLVETGAQTLKKGEVLPVDPIAIHRVFNSGTHPLISFHFYQPPLNPEKTRFFEAASEARKTVSPSGIGEGKE